MNEITIPIHHKIYPLRGKQLIELEWKNEKKFKEVFKTLDTLGSDRKLINEKVMGFLKS